MGLFGKRKKQKAQEEAARLEAKLSGVMPQAGLETTTGDGSFEAALAAGAAREEQEQEEKQGFFARRKKKKAAKANGHSHDGPACSHSDQISTSPTDLPPLDLMPDQMLQDQRLKESHKAEVAEPQPSQAPMATAARSIPADDTASINLGAESEDLMLAREAAEERLAVEEIVRKAKEAVPEAVERFQAEVDADPALEDDLDARLASVVEAVLAEEGAVLREETEAELAISQEEDPFEAAPPRKDRLRLRLPKAWSGSWVSEAGETIHIETLPDGTCEVTSLPDPMSYCHESREFPGIQAWRMPANFQREPIEGMIGERMAIDTVPGLDAGHKGPTVYLYFLASESDNGDGGSRFAEPGDKLSNVYMVMSAEEGTANPWGAGDQVDWMDPSTMFYKAPKKIDDFVSNRMASEEPLRK